MSASRRLSLIFTLLAPAFLSAQSYQTNFAEVKFDRGHSPSVSHGQVQIDPATGAASLDVPLGPGIGARGAQYVPRLSGRWAPQVQSTLTTYTDRTNFYLPPALRTVGGFTLTPGYLDFVMRPCSPSVTDTEPAIPAISNGVLPDGRTFTLNGGAPIGGFPSTTEIQTTLLSDFGMAQGGWKVGSEPIKGTDLGPEPIDWTKVALVPAKIRAGSHGEMVIALTRDDAPMRAFPSSYSPGSLTKGNPWYAPDCLLVVKGGVAYEYRFAVPLYYGSKLVSPPNATVPLYICNIKSIRYRLEAIRNRFGDEVRFTYEGSPDPTWGAAPSAYTAEWVRGGQPLGIKVRVQPNGNVTYQGGADDLSFTSEGYEPVLPSSSREDDARYCLRPLSVSQEFKLTGITSTPSAFSMAFTYAPQTNYGDLAGGGALATVTVPGHSSTLSWGHYSYQRYEIAESIERALSHDWFEGVSGVVEQDTLHPSSTPRTTYYVRTLPVADPATANGWVSTDFFAEVWHPDGSRTKFTYWSPVPTAASGPDSEIQFLAFLKHTVKKTEEFAIPSSRTVPGVLFKSTVHGVRTGDLPDLSVLTFNNGVKDASHPYGYVSNNSEPYARQSVTTDLETGSVETNELDGWDNWAWEIHRRIVGTSDRTTVTTYRHGDLERPHYLGPLPIKETHPNQPIPPKQMTYDSKGRTTRVEINYGAVPSQTVDFTFDLSGTAFAGLPTPATARLTGSNPGTRGADYQYDSRGFLSGIRMLGTSYWMTQTSDEWGRPTTQTDGNGISQTYAWDAFSRLTQQQPLLPELPTTITYDDFGLGAKVDRGSQTSRMWFNGFGETILESREDLVGGETHRLTGRDAAGRTHWQTGWRTGSGLDQKGNWSRPMGPEDSDVGATVGGYVPQCTKWGMDPLTGERVCLAWATVYTPPTDGTLVNKNSSHITYDSRGRVIKVEDANHDVTTTTYARGALGLSRTVTRGSGVTSMVTHFEMDALGRLQQVVNETETGPLLSQYSYDEADRVYRVDQWSAASQTGLLWGGSGLKQTRTWAFNPLGWLTQLVQPESGTTTYSNFDVSGQPLMTDYNGRAVLKGIEALTGRVTSITSVTPGDASVSQTFAYDEPNRGASNGKLTTATANGVVRSMVYSGLNGRLSGLTRTVDGQTFNQSFTYDTYGRLNSRKYPDNKQQVIGFDDAKNAPLITSFGGVSLASLAYAPVTWALNQLSHANGATTAFTYDEDQVRLKTMILNIPGQLSNKTWTYGYDDAQRLLSDDENQYTYDRLGRLRTAVVYDPWGTQGLFQSFDYDAFGNRTSSSTKTITNWVPGAAVPGTVAVISSLRAGVDKVTANFDFSKSSPELLRNQLPAKTAQGGDTGAHYDVQGNLDQVYGKLADNSTLLQLTYDALARVTKLGDTKNATAQTYSYDDEGLRIKVFDSKTSVTTYNIYNEARQLVAIYTKVGTGSLTWKKDIVYVGTKEIAEVSSDGKTYVTLCDHLGTPRYVWSGSGAPVSQKFLPFGEQLSDPTSMAKIAKGFTNHEQTDPSGLIYMQARFYLPMYGRFGSPDPARDQHFEMTQSWNIASYVQNNPVQSIDPTGMVAATPVAAGFTPDTKLEQGENAEEKKRQDKNAQTKSTNDGGTKSATGEIKKTQFGLGVTPKKASTKGKLDKDKAVEHLDDHAETKSQGKCAKYVRQALEAGGMNTTGRPMDAKDYGPFLETKGASEVPSSGYTPQRADIAVFEGSTAHPHGHIQMNDGNQWVSDFKQNNFSPYKTPTPSVIFRFPDN